MTEQRNKGKAYFLELTSNSQQVNYWENYCMPYYEDAKTDEGWENRYIGYVYRNIVSYVLQKHAKQKNPNVLKVDLWNEGIVPSKDVLSRFQNNNCTGFDISKKVCILAKQHLKQDVTQASCLNLPYKTSNFNIVIDLSTIDHIPYKHHQQILNEYARVLAIGGILILIYWKVGLATKHLNKPVFEQLYLDTNTVKKQLANFEILSESDIGWLFTLSSIRHILTVIPFWILRTWFGDNLNKTVARFEFLLKNPFGGLHVIIAEKTDE